MRGSAAIAISLVSRGVNLHIVGRLLGHTQPQTTARYAHLDDHALREATNGFGRLVEGMAKGREANVAIDQAAETAPNRAGDALTNTETYNRTGAGRSGGNVVPLRTS